MATYNNFDELNGKTLKEEDVVILCGIKYIVHSSFMCTSEANNNAYVIEKKLGFRADNFLERCYGYQTRGGDWSECEKYHYEALTRACLVIMGLSEGWDVIIKINGNDERFSMNDVGQQIKVGDYTGVIHKTYLEVGCQKIDYNVVKRIYQTAKKLGYIAAIVGVIALSSCSRSISVFDAANGRARCGMHLKG